MVVRAVLMFFVSFSGCCWFWLVQSNINSISVACHSAAVSSTTMAESRDIPLIAFGHLWTIGLTVNVLTGKTVVNQASSSHIQHKSDFICHTGRNRKTN